LSQKLQELTKKLYQEGVEKARTEADNILAEAEKNKLELISQAESEAEKILAKAKKSAEQLLEQGKSELDMAAGQAVSALKQKITTLLAGHTLGENIKSALSEKEFIKSLILELVKKWDPAGQNLALVLSKEREQEFSAYLQKELKSALSHSPEISFEDRMSGGFKIKSADGSFMLSFTDQDFEQFFQSFVRDKIRTILFEKNK
jgi:V/A-type H+/Na+-transporting ATPase subunit E